MDAYTIHTINQHLVLAALLIMLLVIIGSVIYLAVSDYRDNRQRIADAIEREKRLDARRAADNR